MTTASATFQVLTDPEAIAAAQRQLEAQLRAAATWTGSRKLGFQGGNLETQVTWIDPERIWYSSPDREANRFSNGFGTADPRERAMLSITMWINPPKSTEGTGSGRFIRDTAGTVYLAHLGWIGGGKKGIGKRALFDQLGDQFARVHAGKQEFVLVAPIVGDSTVADIARYVRAVASFKASVAPAADPEVPLLAGGLQARPTLDAYFVGWDIDTRAVILRWLADALICADQQSPNTWVLTRRGTKRLRLNVGRNVVFEINRRATATRPIGVSLHLPSFVGDAAAIARAPNVEDYGFVDVTDGVLRRIPLEAFLANRDALWPAACRFIEDSAKAFANTPFARYHAPDLLDEVERAIGEPLPRREQVPHDPPITDPDDPEVVLSFDDILAQLEAAQLHFPAEVVASYLLALQAKRFVILSGISGTGKTELARGIARIFQPSAHATRETKPVPADGARVTVRPYMLDHNRLVVPASLVQHSGLDRSMDIDVRHEGTQSRTRWSPASTQTQLLLRGPLGEWFRSTFEVGDELDLRLTGTKEQPLLVVEPVAKRSSILAQEQTYELIAVRPDWTDSRGLLGYYNPISREYQTTPFLDLLIRATQEYASAELEDRPPRPYFAILDEMNLARVEHYFSDFLSSLESGEPLHLHDSPEIEDGTGEGVPVPRRLAIPPNLTFTGTVNVDETTYMFSPKVLDRAFVLEFNEVRLRELGDEELDGIGDGLRLDRFDGDLVLAARPSNDDWLALRELGDGRLWEAVIRLNERLELDHRHFGYRVAKEIARFVNLAADQGVDDPEALWDVLDVAVLAKVLPKLHGTQQELSDLLEQLLAFTLDVTVEVDARYDARSPTAAWDFVAGRLQPSKQAVSSIRPRLPRSAAKLWRMLRRVRLHGYVSFIE